MYYKQPRDVNTARGFYPYSELAQLKPSEKQMGVRQCWNLGERGNGPEDPRGGREEEGLSPVV